MLKHPWEETIIQNELLGLRDTQCPGNTYIYNFVFRLWTWNWIQVLSQNKMTVPTLFDPTVLGPEYSVVRLEKNNLQNFHRYFLGFGGILWCFFPIKYLPSFTMITVKGAWKGHVDLHLEVFSIVLCHPTTFYIQLLGICYPEVQAASSNHTGNILFWLQYILKFWSTFFCDRFFSFCSHTLLRSVLESWFLYS